MPKCRNEKCEDFNPLTLNGCDNYNLRSFVKCEYYKSDFDVYCDPEDDKECEEVDE